MKLWVARLILACAGLTGGGIIGSPALGVRTERGSPATPNVDRGLRPEQLQDAPLDPLAPFRLSFDSSVRDLRNQARARELGHLLAKDDVYLQVSLPSVEQGASALATPWGIDVLAGDFYFLSDRHLMEASMLMHDAAGNQHALDQIEATFGKPEFEVVLPGALDMVVGFRTAQGFLLCTFDDLPIFRVSVFRNQPNDLMAGSQMLLFEGLSDYSSRLEAGAPQSDLLPALLEVVNQAGMARSLIKPR